MPKRRAQDSRESAKLQRIAIRRDAFRRNRTQEVAGSSPASSISKVPAHLPLSLSTLRLCKPDLVDDLCENFRRAGFTAHSAGGSMAEIQRLDAPEREQERREVELHLRVWQAMRPEAAVEILN